MSVQPTTKADLIRRAAELSAAYLDAGPEVRIAPDPSAIAALDAFDTRLPNEGTDPAAVLELLDGVGSPATVRSTDGRYFGFVTGGSEPVAAAASMLASTWDQNAALAVMSPVAARLDAIATRWVCELLGLPPTAEATFCSGASVSNLTCLIAARDALLDRNGWDVAARGLLGAPAIDVVTSAEVHASIPKLLRAIGIGSDSITTVPTDGAGRMRPDALPDLGPRTLLIGQAGNVNTGHSDPFTELVPAVHDGGGWVHIDGAFGLWAATSPEHADLVAGSERADSWATDAHKWLNVPYDSGLAICARGEDLRRAMAIDAAYLSSTSGREPMHLNLQMSQRARAIETWATIAARGRNGITELIQTCCDHTARLAELLAAGGAEILAPVVLNQALVSFGGAEATNAVIAAVQADGTCWAGGTTWQGHRAMRLSVSNSATTAEDIERSAAAILGLWRNLSAT